LPESTEVAAYYVVSEALTNVAKHARASEVNVRVEAVGGMLEICSHPGSGTSLLVKIPLEVH
jgi:signal transduction histidine kinase